MYVFNNAAGTRKRSGCGDCQGCSYRATGLWHLHQLGNCVLKSLIILYSSIKDTLSPLIYDQLGIHLTNRASCYCRICTFTINFNKLKRAIPDNRRTCIPVEEEIYVFITLNTNYTKNDRSICSFYPIKLINNVDFTLQH